MARRIVLHPSLTKIVLLAGGNRTATIILWFGCGALVWCTRINLLTIAIGLSLAIGGQMVLRKWAKADPLFIEKYFRSLQYQGYYQAHSGGHAKSARIRPSVPKV